MSNSDRLGKTWTYLFNVSLLIGKNLHAWTQKRTLNMNSLVQNSLELCLCKIISIDFIQSSICCLCENQLVAQVHRNINYLFTWSIYL